ncbi:MAG: hypothetical protein OHK0029_16670 [Armatimonadaceae bacterium]
MQLSREEYLRISQIKMSTSRGEFAVESVRVIDSETTEVSGSVFSGRSEEARRLSDTLAETSDVRDDVVASLRARIESGNYLVTGEGIAEMMVRRLLADQVR